MPNWVVGIISITVVQLAAFILAIFKSGKYFGQVDTRLKSIDEHFSKVAEEIRVERAERREEIRNIWKAIGSKVNSV